MNDPSEIEYPIEETPEQGQAHAVAPGVRWIRMPLPFALDHINLWALDDVDGVTLVDTGFAQDGVKDCWNRILEADGRAVSSILVTHFHPDHLGLASWLSEKSGAPIVMTQGEFLTATAVWHQLPGHSIEDMVALYRAHGLPEDRLEALSQRGNSYARGVPDLPRKIRRIFEGDELTIGEYTWKVIIGHGHAPEHACLYCDETGVLIAGDMLLPRISTNVSVHAAMPDDDPLEWFLLSLQRIKDLPEDTLVLPSHGRPFRGLRARIAQLEEHHRERCDALLAVLDTPKHAGELLPTLFQRELDNHQVMFAMGEAIAHLTYLVNKDEARRQTGRDGTIRYERTT